MVGVVKIDTSEERGRSPEMSNIYRLNKNNNHAVFCLSIIFQEMVGEQ